MKKQFDCTNCTGRYEASWSRGLCPTCRRREHYKDTYKSSDPYSIHATREIKTVVDDMNGDVSLYSVHKRHHPRHRTSIESHNDLVRRYYKGRF